MAPRQSVLIFWKIQNIVIDISPVISCLEKFWFSSYGSKCCWLTKLQDSLKSNISKRKWMVKFIFGMQIDIKVFYKLILWFWVCVAIHTQSTLNKKSLYTYLCKISRKTWGTKLIFCLLNTKVLYKLMLSFLGVHNQACPKYLK